MSERRVVPRYLFEGPAFVALGPDGPNLKITLQIISLKGCGAFGEAVPAKGEKCKLRFEWRGREFLTEAEVVWRKTKGEAGMRFLTLDEETLNQLRQLCATLPLEPLAPLPPEIEKKI